MIALHMAIETLRYKIDSIILSLYIYIHNNIIHTGTQYCELYW